jgi:pantetheine-phosphate adenylyltransferase
MGYAALCPGTFDPVTNGHLDIIQRAARSFDRVLVAVLQNPDKEPLFAVDERVELLRRAVQGIDKTGSVEVDSFSGLLVDYARSHGIGIIVKGLRAVSDFDFELQMAQMNHRMSGIETFFVPTSPQWSYLSSSLIKQVVRFGADVSGLVPTFVQARLEAKLAPVRPGATAGRKE